MPEITIREKIYDQLDMRGEKKQLSLHTRRVAVNENQYHLIIGLGGTGVQALLEAKGYINLTCEDANRRVAYIAFDTCKSDMESFASSPETGKVKLEGGEIKLLSTAGTSTIFAPAHINNVLNTSPELFTWVDESITPVEGDKGANGVRQVGRLILIRNYNMVAAAIRSTVNTLTQTAPANSALNVYILAGISGGTGSGSVIDMPYIVRKALDGMNTFVRNNNSIFGYLFMPDVNEERGGEPALLRRNAYAALQELDYNMAIGVDLRESYTINYGNGNSVVPGTTDKPMFNFVHLVSATDNAGSPIKHPYETSMRAIAQNILSFVANEQAEADGGSAAYAISSHYNNIQEITNNFLSHMTSASRYHKYLAIGSYDYELPIDDIMMYITSLLFQRMDGMYEKTPSDSELSAMCENTLGLTMNKIVARYMGAVPQLRMPDNPTYDNLKNGSFDWWQRGQSAYGNSGMYLSQISQCGQQILSSIRTLFDQQMSDKFLNSEMGPVYVSRLITSDGGVLAAIRKNMEDCTKYIGANPHTILQGTYQDYQKKLAELKGTGFLTGSETKRKLTEEVNSLGRKTFQAFVQFIVASDVTKVYNELYTHINSENSKIYDFVTETLNHLRDVFKSNANILTRTSEETGEHGAVFTWDRLSIPMLDKLLTDKFDLVLSRTRDGKDGNGLKQKMDRFLEDLWKKARDWMRDSSSYDPRAFISTFIDQQFGGLSQLTIEEIAISLLEDQGKDLKATVCEILMPRLVQQSAPLFYPIQNDGIKHGSTALLISIPKKCTRIYEAARQFIIQGGLRSLGIETQPILQKSDINNRIYAQSICCAVPLAGYNMVWECEREYAASISNPGVHLINAIGPHAVEKKSWNNLCTLIPKLVRPNSGIDPKVQALIQAEDRNKAHLKGMFDSEYQSKSPIVQLVKDINSWRLVFQTTDLRMESDPADPDVLIIRANATAPDVRYTISRMSQGDLKKLETLLNGILTKGIVAAFGDTNPETSQFARTVRPTMITGIPDGEKTMADLLEEYVRHYDLIHNFKRECEKYECAANWLKKLKEYGGKLDAIKAQLFRFTQCWILEALGLRENALTGRTEGVVGKRNATSLVEFQTGTDEYAMYYEMYRLYLSGGKDGMRRALIDSICDKGIERYAQLLQTPEGLVELRKAAENLGERIAHIQDDKMLDARIYGISAEVVSFFGEWRQEVGRLTEILKKLLGDFENQSLIANPFDF